AMIADGPEGAAGKGRPDPSAHLRALLLRMRRGDRHAAAEFVVENADSIRRRFRRRISGSVRRLFDSADLVSTVARRLDGIVGRGRLAAGSVGELWSLVMVVGRYSLSEHAGRARRPALPPAPPAPAPPSDPDASLLERCLASLR